MWKVVQWREQFLKVTKNLLFNILESSSSIWPVVKGEDIFTVLRKKNYSKPLIYFCIYFGSYVTYVEVYTINVSFIFCLGIRVNDWIMVRSCEGLWWYSNET